MKWPFGKKEEVVKETKEVDHSKKTFFCNKCGQPAEASEEGFRYSITTGKLIQKDFVWNCMNPDCYGNPIMRVQMELGLDGSWIPVGIGHGNADDFLTADVDDDGFCDEGDSD